MNDGTAASAVDSTESVCPTDSAGGSSPGAASSAGTGRPPDDETAGTDRQWSSTAVGVAVVAADVLLLALVAVGTTGVLDAALASAGLPAVELAVTVPGYVYVFAVMGALGYVFTALVEGSRLATANLVAVNLRIPAALPLAAGLYLLVGQFLGADVPTRIVAGVAFLAGLFVNLAYCRLGSLARRLLPPTGDDADSGDRTDDGSSAD